jgi:hypothetical protein
MKRKAKSYTGIQDYWVFGLCPLPGILKNKVQKPSSPECHIPSSEPFKVSLYWDVRLKSKDQLRNSVIEF